MGGVTRRIHCLSGFGAWSYAGVLIDSDKITASDNSYIINN